MMRVTARNTSSSSGESGPSSSLTLGLGFEVLFPTGGRLETSLSTPLSRMRRHCSSLEISTRGFVRGDFELEDVPELLPDFLVLFRFFDIGSEMKQASEALRARSCKL